MSLIGKKPIAVPSGVKVQAENGLVLVEGPKGKISRPLSHRLNLELKDN